MLSSTLEQGCEPAAMPAVGFDQAREPSEWRGEIYIYVLGVSPEAAADRRAR
jgi:hypothetical protein